MDTATPKKILVVDDDPNVTRLLQAKLSAQPGIIVQTVNVASEAPALAQSFRPDLVVCDIDMGEMWGGEVTHAIHRQPLTAKTPVVLLSSMVTPGDMVAPSGGRRLISKKLPIADIITHILKELPA